MTFRNFVYIENLYILADPEIYQKSFFLENDITLRNAKLGRSAREIQSREYVSV